MGDDLATHLNNCWEEPVDPETGLDEEFEQVRNHWTDRRGNVWLAVAFYPISGLVLVPAGGGEVRIANWRSLGGRDGRIV